MERMLKEEQELTFKPVLNANKTAQPRLNLRNPEAYLTQVKTKLKLKEEQVEEAHRQRLVCHGLYLKEKHETH